jgi:CRISPR-associated protein Csm1
MANLTPWREADGFEVRDTSTMADKDATGIHRYGVLRMDVDGLGAVFQTELRFRDLLHTAALSAAITIFFEGHLNAICRQAAAKWRDQVGALNPPDDKSERQSGQNSEVMIPYIIYSGGDDLFVVGCWDVLPIVAQELREKFAKYTSTRLTMSAGIALGYNKFPLYQVAEMAKRSLDRSKAREVIDATGQTKEQKDGITFLGMTVGWEQFARAKDLAVVLSRLILSANGQSGKKAPRALLHVLGTSALAYRQEMRESATPGSGIAQGSSLPQSGGIMLGKWLWRLSYGLLRLAARAEAPVREGIMALNGDPSGPTSETQGKVWAMIDYLGLPVRWAEFLIRKEG